MTESIFALHRPLELVFVRHGESEGNAANRAARNGDTSRYDDAYRNRHSSTWKLTNEGIEQAKAAGQWIRGNINGGEFNKHYVSTYIRARKTAGLLGLPNALWEIKDYVREHDLGYTELMTDEERRATYPEAMRQRDIDRYYYTPPGGESLADAVLRTKVGIIATLYRELPDQRGIIVAHGNIMWPVRMILEGLTPEQYSAIWKAFDQKDVINNCQIMQYSRINPHDGSVSNRFDWTRSVCPWDLSRSSNEWRPIVHKKYTNEELLNM